MAPLIVFTVCDSATLCYDLRVMLIEYTYYVYYEL